jgi:hypothetical protein
MAGRGAGGFVSIHQFVLDGATEYFRVILHPRLPQKVCPIAADCLHPQAQLLAIDLLPVKLFNRARNFPLEVVHSLITETESMEMIRSSVFWLKGRKSRHQL